MANENANQDIEFDDFDLECEQISNQLEEQLKEHVEGLEFLKEEIEQIGNPDNLGNVIQEVVWEQFINQIGVIAGEDFIKENRNLHLDLRDKAHIQIVENFVKGDLATHNHESIKKIEESYDRYKNVSHKEFRQDHENKGMDNTLKRAGKLYSEGIKTVKDAYTGKQISTQTKLENGKNNPKAAQRDHVISSSETYKNPESHMGRSNEEYAAYVNRETNLVYTKAETNNKKSDKSYNDLDKHDQTKHGEKVYKNSKEDGEQKNEEKLNELHEKGRKSQKEEAFRIGGKVLRAVVMTLLADLTKEIIAKLVKWFKSAQKNLKSLLESLKEAIRSFFGKMKTHLFNSGNTIFSTVITAILGPISRMLTSVWTLLKQGWKSLKEAVEYIRKPENKGKPIGRLMLETGKIVIAGLTAINAIALGQVIEKGLMAVPPFAFPIPLIGSLASILGIFFGAVVTGIIGAIAINMIEKKIEKSRKRENIEGQVIAGNNILQLQYQMGIVSEEKLKHDKFRVVESIKERHSVAADMTRESLGNIAANCKKDESIANDIDRLLKELDDDKL